MTRYKKIFPPVYCVRGSPPQLHRSLIGPGRACALALFDICSRHASRGVGVGSVAASLGTDEFEVSKCLRRTASLKSAVIVNIIFNFPPFRFLHRDQCERFQSDAGRGSVS